MTTVNLDAALEEIQAMLNNDGYEVRLDEYAAGELKLTILARPGACEECLVPKDMMAEIISATLPAELGGPRVVLTYPEETH